MPHPAGELNWTRLFELDFDRRLMLQFRGSVVTSDAGLLAYRELNDALGLTEMAGEMLADARTGKNGRHALVGLLRQSVFGRLAGYEDVNECATTGDALDCWWQSGSGSCSFTQPDGPFRDAMACSVHEPLGSCRSFRPIDRPRARPSPAERRCARHGFQREPRRTGAGDQHLERSLRLHLLSPAILVQSVWRFGTLRSAPRQPTFPRASSLRTG